MSRVCRPRRGTAVPSAGIASGWSTSLRPLENGEMPKFEPQGQRLHRLRLARVRKRLAVVRQVRLGESHLHWAELEGGRPLKQEIEAAEAGI